MPSSLSFGFICSNISEWGVNDAPIFKVTSLFLFELSFALFASCLTLLAQPVNVPTNINAVVTILKEVLLATKLFLLFQK